MAKRIFDMPSTSCFHYVRFLQLMLDNHSREFHLTGSNTTLTSPLDVRQVLQELC
jgi:hypothetical protein